MTVKVKGVNKKIYYVNVSDYLYNTALEEKKESISLESYEYSYKNGLLEHFNKLLTHIEIIIDQKIFPDIERIKIN